MHTERSRTLHDARRRIWSPAFSDKALRGYEERIKPYEEKLVQQFRAFGGQSINVSEWFNYFSFDVMGDLAFGESFQMLEKGEEHWAIKLLNEGMEPLHFMFPTWFFRMIVAIPGAMNDYHRFNNYAANKLDKRITEGVKIPDIVSTLLAPFNKSGKPSGADLMYLQGDTKLIIVAGSDTTAATLAHLFYHLAAEPQHVKRIRDEITRHSDAKGEINHADIIHAEYLNGCINEALRLHPPVPTAMHRNTPPEGIEIGGTHIPGDVDVWCPQYVISRSEDCYTDARRFVPERWFSKPDMVKNRSAFSPFSQGVYGCIGRPLALLELRKVVSKLVITFDVELAPGEDGHELLYKTRDHFTLGLGALKLRFKERKS
ncbi:hypothetical protein LTS18_001733 [Coniosporium uncinatum]|uniref:Uncharacterized protein n=1 Tax=Coniosporium uncinatum TaxID=93489 RepID=A0ACC3DCA4_9PEZI|nr:hypothetical protein LTS18_001733 [Coniosporium uncinatum]